MVASQTRTGMHPFRHWLKERSAAPHDRLDAAALGDNARTDNPSQARELYLRKRLRMVGGSPGKPPPGRRGFGRTIIEKSIPLEPNGRANVEYKRSSVKAQVWVRGRYVNCEQGGQRNPRRGSFPGRETLATGNVTAKRILLVEDSMIIALDTEECLLQLGAESVTVQGTVAGALDVLGKQQFDLALLDFNLGTESSEMVADELRRVGVPFWLATGYGEMAEKLAEIGAAGLLVKPYGRDELVKIIRDADADEGDGS